MSEAALKAVFAPATWLVVALLCLLLEAAGTPVGARKKGTRPHLPWIVALAGTVIVAFAFIVWRNASLTVVTSVGLVFDRPGLLSCAALAILVVAAHTAAVPGLRAFDEERGEMSAAFAIVAAGLSLVAVANDLVVLAAGFVLSTSALALLTAPDREGPHGIEAATKGIIGAGLVLVLLSLAALFAWAASGDTTPASIGRALVTEPQLAVTATALVVVVLALVIGAVPMHQAFVDVAHGASAASSSLLAGGALIAGGGALLRFVDGVALSGPQPSLATAWSVLAALTLIGAPIASLDQMRIGRVVAYLAVVPGGLVLAAAAIAAADSTLVTAAWRDGTEAALSGALGGAAALLGVVLPRLDASSTWEDWAGFGRKRPVMAALFVYALATAAGLPGTIGFVARLDVARSCVDAHLDVLAVIVVASAAAGAGPLVRLALFLFAKDPPPRLRAERPEPSGLLLTVAFAILVVASAILAIAPWSFVELVAAARS